MKIRLPFIEVSLDKVEPEIKLIESEEKAVYGDILDMPTGLSTQTTASEKLIQSYQEWVYANVSVLSEEVSKLEPKLFQMNFRRGQLEMEEVDEHPVLELLDRFNEATTRSDGFYLTQAHLELAGDSFWLLVGENIFLLQPDKMELKLGEFGDAGRLIEGYKYKDTVKGESIEKDYEPDEIIHIKVPNPANPYRGKSVVEAAARTIDTDNLSGEASKKFFQQGMIANFALFTEGKLNDQQLKQIKSELRHSQTGVKNAYKVPVFSGGLKPETLQMSNKDVELIKQQMWLRDRIMALFKNNKVSLGITDDVNRANAEATIADWRRSVVKPKIKRIVDALNEHLIPNYGDNLILGFEEPVPEDRTAKIKEISDLLANAKRPVMTINEARQMLDLDDVSGGDDIPEALPTQIRNVDWQTHFRRLKMFSRLKDYQSTFSVGKQIAESVKNKEAKKPSKRKINNFWRRVAEIIERYEDVFRNHLESFILDIAQEAVENFAQDESRKNGELFDRERRILEAQVKFVPILMESLALAGAEANEFLGVDEPFVPKKVKDFNTEQFIRDKVALFATGMLDTDRDILSKLIADGLAEGLGIPKIRRNIQEKFEQFSKTQAERITRTEVARAANRGITDSYIQNGIETQQWLTAPDACSYCAPMNGKIVGVTENFFNQGDEWLGDAKTPLKLDYDDIGEPPLHPNCRCTTIAVTETFGPLIPAKEIVDDPRVLDQARKIVELEAQIDKRTKAYRNLKLKAKKRELEDKEYIKELEGLVNE